MNKIVLLISGLLGTFVSTAQCDSVQIPSNYTLASDLIMSGTYVVNGTFTVPAGVTVFVTSFATNGCGELKIYATDIVIDGTIDGNYSGYEGGTGGIRGTVVSSATGHATSLSTCDDPDNQGNIIVQAGGAGGNGAGPGMGQAGLVGVNGSGSKQYCGNSQDEAGVIGGAGGAGGGSGGSYGGVASTGGSGGDGAYTAVTNNLPIEGSYPIVGGDGGNGGTSSAVYGTASGRDIALGSGGAGAGAGGRSYYLGTNGTSGGTGGGMVFLKADNSLSITGTITVAGNNGAAGGNGGSGDATADCCSDGCNACDERTFSAGAGAGAGAGGGSGGGIFLEGFGAVAISGTLNASGGDGGAGGTNGSGIFCEYTDFFCGDQSITTGEGNDGELGGAGAGGRIKIYVADCALANVNPTIVVNGGTGFAAGGVGTFEEVCGYLGLNEGERSLGWSAYPNPVNDVLTISIYSGYDFSTDGKIDLFNSLGQNVLTLNEISEEMTLSTADLKQGMYTVRITTQSGTEIKKIIKE